MNRSIAVIALVLALAPALAYTPAASGAPSIARAVGAFIVDAGGHATGAHMTADVDERAGMLTDVSSNTLRRALFDAVAVDGFSSAGKLQGVNSAALRLNGEAASLTLHDDPTGALIVEALNAGAATARFDLASGVVGMQRTSTIVDLEDRAGQWLGSVVAIDGAARGEGLSLANGEVVARLLPGGAAAFFAATGDADLGRVLIDAASHGDLVASFVTEVDGATIATSQVDLVATRSARTLADGRGLVETSLRSQLSADSILSYDLAYETLPARAASDVAVFVDGARIESAATPADLQAALDAGVASAYATVGEGRAHVLAAIPSDGGLSHRILVAAGDVANEAQARIERSGGARGASLSGELSYHANGKLIGGFLSGILSSTTGRLSSYSSLASGVEVFRLVEVPGNGGGSLHVEGASQMLLDGPLADITLVDDAYATLIVEAAGRAEPEFDLAPGIRAVEEAKGVVRLDSAKGNVGWLIAIPGEGAASLDASSAGEVTGLVEKGGRILFRGASGELPSDLPLAKAISAGELGAQIVAGIEKGHVAAASASHQLGASASVVSAARGHLELVYTAADSAGAIVVDAPASALPAKSASDITVLVDGKVAQRVDDADDLFGKVGAAPRSFVELADDGGLRILVETAAKPSSSVRVLIESGIDRAAKASLASDAFGAFKVFADGTAVGDFVSLRTDRLAGAVADLSLASEGRAVFSSIVSGESSFRSIGIDGAPTLLLENAESRLEVADATTAFVRAYAKTPTEVAFHLAAGLEARAIGADVIDVVDASSGESIGSLLVTGTGALDVDGRQVTGQLAEGAQALFKAHVGIESELAQEQRALMDRAIAAGRVAGHVLVQPQFDPSLLERNSIGETLPLGRASVATAYAGDIDILTAATRDRVDVTVSSATSAGKTILISLDPTTLPALARGEAEVLFDGVPVAEADTFADVLDAADDGGLAESFVLAGEAGTSVLVSIPHFSVHTVTLQPRSTAGGLYPYVTIFLGLLVAGQAVLLWRSRRSA